MGTTDRTLCRRILRCFFILCLVQMELITAQQLCQDGNQTTNTVNLNMDTTPILGKNGTCSCNITVDDEANIGMFPSPITVPNCNTKIELVDSTFTFNCVNGKIPVLPQYTNHHSTGEILLLRVTTTVSSVQSLSGSLQIKADQASGGVADPKITVECFEPNSKLTTSTSASSTTTTTTSTTTMPRTTTAEITKTSPHTTINTPKSSSPSSTAGGTNTSTNTRNGQTPTETTEVKSTISQSQSSSSLPSSDSGVTGGTGQSSATTTPTTSDQTDKATGNKENNFPVAAVAGGVGGGLVLILIIVIAVTCLRRKHKEDPKLMENGRENNNHGQGHINQSYEDNETKMIDNSLYQPGSYDYDDPANQQGLVKDQDTSKQTSQPVSSSPPVFADNGLYASADDLPQTQDAAKPAPIINEIPDHYVSVGEAPAGLPGTGDGPSESQEVIVSPSGDIYAVVDKSRQGSPDITDGTPPDSAVTQNVSADEDLSQPLHDVAPSGDVYAVVDKTTRPFGGDDDAMSLTENEHQQSDQEHTPEPDHVPDGAADDVVVDNANQRNVSSEADNTPTIMDNIQLQSNGLTHSDSSVDEEEAALNMMAAVSDEGLDEDSGTVESRNDTPEIQSTEL